MVQVPFAGPVESDDDNFTSHLHHFILYWISGNEFLMFFSSDLAVVKNRFITLTFFINFGTNDIRQCVQ